MDSKGLLPNKEGSGALLATWSLRARSKHSSLLASHRGVGSLPWPDSSQRKLAELAVSQLGEVQTHCSSEISEQRQGTGRRPRGKWLWEAVGAHQQGGSGTLSSSTPEKGLAKPQTIIRPETGK